MIKRYIILIIGLIIIILVKGHPLNNDDSKIITQEESVDHNSLKFILVGDPQINLSTGDGIEKLKNVVNYINKSDVDFVVFLGDMTDDGKEKSNDVIKSILENMNKPYYVVVGNHDIKKSSKIFEHYYGPMEHIENIKGYQLIFIGINLINSTNGERLNWSFDFNKVNKSLPTLVFIHGPVVNIKGCVYCLFQKDNIYYAESIKSELEKFTNLISVYSGHSHFDSNSIYNKTRYVTVNGLIKIELFNIPFVRSSNYVGYSMIKDNQSYYRLIPYKNS